VRRAEGGGRSVLSHSRTLALSHSRTLALSHSRTLALSHYFMRIPVRQPLQSSRRLRPMKIDSATTIAKATPRLPRNPGPLTLTFLTAPLSS
jgi:hypothetical protein